MSTFWTGDVYVSDTQKNMSTLWTGDVYVSDTQKNMSTFWTGDVDTSNIFMEFNINKIDELPAGWVSRAGNIIGSSKITWAEIKHINT